MIYIKPLTFIILEVYILLLFNFRREVYNDIVSNFRTECHFYFMDELIHVSYWLFSFIEDSIL